MKTPTLKALCAAGLLVVAAALPAIAADDKMGGKMDKMGGHMAGKMDKMSCPACKKMMMGGAMSNADKMTMDHMMSAMSASDKMTMSKMSPAEKALVMKMAKMGMMHGQTGGKMGGMTEHKMAPKMDDKMGGKMDKMGGKMQ